MKHKFFHRYLSAKVLPIWTILLIDVLIIVVSSLLAYALRYDFQSIFLESSTIDKTIVWTVIVNLVFFRVFRTYSNVLRFSSFIDIMRIFVSLTVSYALLMISSVLLASYLDIRLAPVSVLFMAYIISFAIMSCSRIVVKMFYELLNFDGSHSANVFIYGAKEAGVNIAKALRVNLRNHYRLRGFIADEPELINKVMMGVKVFPNDESLIDVLNDRDVHTIIISPAKMEELKKSDMADRLLAHNIKLMTAPPLSEWSGQTLNRTQLKEIQIEDLLQRDPIEIDIHKVASHLEGKRVMITGAAGSIGSELCRQLCTFNLKQLILFDSAETPMHNIRLELEEKFPQVEFTPVMGDIRMIDRVESVFRRFQPQYVFHAAAYKHVPLMEENPCEAVHTNVYGTRNVADMAVRYNVDKFIMVSTDKAVNPTNVMGASKRLAEIYVQSLSIAISKGLHPGKTRFITTRFGNVLGSNGSVIPRFREQLAKGGPLTVTHPDIIRYFMTIPEACRLVLEAAFMGKGNEIFVFDMGTPVKIADLARRMIELAGLIPDEDIEIQYTGLRPGEKLYEELLATKENTLPTENKKIYCAQVREYDYNDICIVMNPLINLAIRVDKMETVRMMKRIVPEFKSKNSEYEMLD